MKRKITNLQVLTLLLAVPVALFSIAAIYDYNLSHTPPITAFTEDDWQKIIDVQALCQYPELPTGCETVSAVMALNYYGERVTPTEFAEDWLIKSELYTKNNRIYGVHPDTAFIGSPFTENSFGCYAPVIARAINGNSSICKAENLTGYTIEQLCEKYIDKKQPVIIWATMYMKKEKLGRTWYISDSESFTWTAGEHCLLLVGYDNSYYYFNDPMVGRAVKYEKVITESRYKALGNQAVLITKQ